MGLFNRLGRRGGRQARGGTTTRAARREEVEEARRHLEDFVRTRVGVEAYIEPPTTFIPPTVLLIATTGEWTRRRVGDPSLVRGLAEGLRVPVYDVQLVGYPQRMRDWNQKVKRAATSPAPPPAAQQPAKGQPPQRQPPAAEEIPPWGTPSPPA